MRISRFYSKNQCNFVIPEGRVARYSFEKRDFFADGKPKPRIFSPEIHPNTGRFETSICGLNGTSEKRFWYLGDTIRAPKRALAAAEIRVAGVAECGLRCESAPEHNFPEHGVITEWGSDKDERLSVCQDLVAKISTILKPSKSIEK